eukprot:TRINITY_DN1822_c1_g1_i1.p1 TRINITY_DN1822_c1_g1~~TRINITY_DN1822_c1_g1_i1.p1  ORF type:complete len:379 (-),score=55.22 TRINITY_DN1822_c1_g1_i1:59-1114(-)
MAALRMHLAMLAWTSSAVAFMVTPPRGRAGKDGTVCISLAAFEEPAYIDALMANIAHFMEPTTKVALHLNAVHQGNYSDEDVSRWGGAGLNLRRGAESSDAYNIERWQSDRVAVTTSNLVLDSAFGLISPTVSDERVEVRAFMGAVMAAHVVNAKTMEKRWPGECAYFLMQASNMMWVRKGAEAVVRENKYSRIAMVKGPWAESGRHNFTAELSPDSKLFGWGQHEGSFYPMADVVGFYKMLDRHLEATKTTLETSIVHFRAYFEESWLPTYVLNFASTYHTENNSAYPVPMCCRIMHYGERPKDTDGMTVEEIKQVLDPANKAMQKFYAVKRVSRVLEDPGTQFILAMSK